MQPGSPVTYPPLRDDAAAPEHDEVKIYTCPDCDKTFDTPQGLGSHRSRAHGFRKPKPKARRARVETKGQVALNDDKLLREIFPDGRVPFTAIPATLAWLEQARQLHERGRKR